MNAHDAQKLCGLSIRSIQTSDAITNAGTVHTLDYIELSDGTRLVPIAYETEVEPIGDLVVSKPR